MDINLISIIIFYSVLFLLFIRYKKKFLMQGILAIYKTKLGLKSMDRLAKAYPKVLNIVSVLGVIAGFFGMFFGFYFIAKETIKYLITPGGVTPLVPVLPGIAIPGVPTLSFWHWIIAIFIAAVLHEFSHGVIARLHNVPIKSSGFAFLGPILAAFVEPEEDILSKKKPMHQLGIYAAGPFSNILLGILFFFVFTMVTAPLFTGSMQPDGITIGATLEGYPAQKAGIEAPFTITKINENEIISAEQFMKLASTIKPGDKLKLETTRGNYELVAAANPENKSLGFIGLSGFQQKVKPAGIAKGRPWLLKTFGWINLLAMWLFVINIGIAIFNLLPFTPADGGKMLLVALTSIMPKRGKQVWLAVNIMVISLIVVNLLPWVFKLLAWIFKIFVIAISFGLS